MSERPAGAVLTREQQTLVENVAGLVEARVDWQLRRLRSRRVANDFRRELIAEGHQAVSECAQRYSAKVGASFATFARYRVDGAILDAIHKDAKHRGLRAAARAALHTGVHVHELPAEDTMRPIDDDEVTADQKFRKVMNAKAMAAVLSFAAQLENLAAEQLDPEEAAALAPVKEAVRAERGELTGRDQQLVHCVYDLHMDLRDAAPVVGLAYPTVKVLHAKILASLREGMKARGYSSRDRDED